MLQPKKLANNVELMMAYNFRSLGKVSFVIRVSIRFNGVSVMVMKQGIVPCKLLIAASEITVFLGSNITDVKPFFSPSEPLTIPPPKKIYPPVSCRLVPCQKYSGTMQISNIMDAISIFIHITHECMDSKKLIMWSHTESDV